MGEFSEVGREGSRNVSQPWRNLDGLVHRIGL